MKNNYTLNGNFTHIAKKLNPYSGSPSTNIIRTISDAYSRELSSQEKSYSFRDLAALALNFTEGRDFYSGEQLLTPTKLIIDEELIHRDHLFPASKGGLYVYGNVVITSQYCNIEKSDMSPYEYYEYRFNEGLPTLYKTLDEAFEAINFLHSKFSQLYPNASLFINEFNQLEMPYTWGEFSDKISYWVSDMQHLKFIKRTTGSRNLGFDSNLKDLEFWEALSNPKSMIYKKYKESTIRDISTSRLIHVSTLFVNHNLSVLETPPKLINQLIDELIIDKTKSEKSKYNTIKNNLLRYRRSYKEYSRQKEKNRTN